VEIRSDRRHRFDVGSDALWTRIEAVEEYESWWPWLSGFSARGLVPGDTWRATVHPPLPYVLRFAIVLGEVEAPRRVEAHIDGDIEGWARLSLRDVDGGSEARLESVLSPRNGMLRRVATVARPLVAFGHDWVLDAGFRQFARRGLAETRS